MRRAEWSSCKGVCPDELAERAATRTELDNLSASNAAASRSSSKKYSALGTLSHQPATRLLVTQCHPELACLAAIGKSAAGMTGRALTAWCSGSLGASASVTLRIVNRDGVTQG